MSESQPALRRLGFSFVGRFSYHGGSRHRGDAHANQQARRTLVRLRPCRGPHVLVRLYRGIGAFYVEDLEYQVSWKSSGDAVTFPLVLEQCHSDW